MKTFTKQQRAAILALGTMEAFSGERAVSTYQAAARGLTLNPQTVGSLINMGLVMKATKTEFRTSRTLYWFTRNGARTFGALKTKGALA